MLILPGFCRDGGVLRVVHDRERGWIHNSEWFNANKFGESVPFAIL